ncbi:MAG: hypothetical protein R2716_07780 [Microthrixaceae bacterium]
MEPTIRTASGDGDLMAALRVDLGSFGLAHGATCRAAKPGTLDAVAAHDHHLPGRDRLRGRRHGPDLRHGAGAPPGGASVPVAGIGDVGVLPRVPGGGAALLVERILDDATDSSRTAWCSTRPSRRSTGASDSVPPRAAPGEPPRAQGKLRADVSVAEGRCELLEPEGWIDVLPGVFERAARRRGGEVSRSAELWEKVLCAPGDDSGLLAEV